MSDLLVEQVEFADVLVVNKTDLVTAQQAGQVAELLRRLNPGAKVRQRRRWWRRREGKEEGRG